MAEEFQSGICGGTWWNPSRSSSLSPCSAAGIGMATDHIGSFIWSSSDLMLDMKPTTTTTKSCEESNNSVSGDSSMVFQSAQKQADSDSGGSSSILLDSTLQMMNFCPSSSTSDWNHALLPGNKRAENNYRSLMQEELNSQFQKDWSPKSFTSTGDESSITIFKSINQDFSSSDNCSGLSAGFPINSASYGYSSALLQSYFEPDPQPPQSLYANRSVNYISSANYGTNCSDLSPSWPKHAPFLKPSLPKQQPSGLHFTNNTPFWNATATSTGLNDTRSSTGFCSSAQTQFLAPPLGEKRNCSSLAIKSNNGEGRDPRSAMKNKGSSEPPFTRPRIETPSPLPTFKVRKEKLGDRITALQQLVSPFGKTDTASVLHEAIEYIKFLQDQVNVLTAPYMKQGTQIQQPQVPGHKLEVEPESPKQDLKSRGLCLVPISSTFPVANETTVDFWTPTFGGTFSLEKKLKKTKIKREKGSVPPKMHKQYWASHKQNDEG